MQLEDNSSRFRSSSFTIVYSIVAAPADTLERDCRSLQLLLNLKKNGNSRFSSEKPRCRPRRGETLKLLRTPPTLPAFYGIYGYKFCRSLCNILLEHPRAFFTVNVVDPLILNSSIRRRTSAIFI